MKNYIVKSINSQPGIQRDGTPFGSQSYIDGQWCRFYMNRPRKIGGYKLIDGGNNEIIRSMFAVSKPNSVDVYLGRISSLNYNNFDFNGNGTGEIDRTPVGYISDPANIWSFDLFTNTTNTDSSTSYIVAAVIPNGDDISNITNGRIYYGDVEVGAHTSGFNSPLTLVTDIATGTPIEMSGGILFSSPVLIAYGNNGLIRWTAEGDITSWPDKNFLVISNTKVIKMFVTRGSVSPQALCWTLSSLVNITYTQIISENTFVSTTIQEGITVMSPGSIVEYNQQFFWIGIDQFYFFNGIVQRLDNSMSTDWFFQNINLSQRSKVWGMTIPRYKEIWWFYPRGDSTECNAVIIYNAELNVWYDSFISRAAGISPGTFPLPLMSDSEIGSIPSGRGVSNSYGLWMHEFGFDKVIGNTNLAIESFFETNILTLFESQSDNNRLIRTRRIEPDFAQQGNMTLTVNNRMFASDTISNGNLIQSGPYTFSPNTRKIDDVTSQGRLVSYVFSSNEAGGAYQAGQTLIDYEIGDINP
jgi:hypothetical protein